MSFVYRTILSVILIFSSCSASESVTGLTAYLQLLEQYPEALGPMGDWEKGEIEIVRDPAKIAEVEKSTNRTVGIVARDKYWIWINDAVRFPNGTYGVYGRMMWTQSLHGTAGVAVLCVLPDGKIALNCNYRHATRTWEIELPRGGVSPGETLEETARREVLEETGMVVEDLVFLGETVGDSGMTSATVPVYLARVVRQEKATPEDSEAIEAIMAFSVDELLRGIKAGEVEVGIRGSKCKVKLRDPFLVYALMQAHLRGIDYENVL